MRSLIKSGPFAIAAGLGTLGLSSYVFLLVAGRALGDVTYAPLGTVWVLIYLLAPAFFFPVEQEVSRAVAARRARGEGIGPVVRQAMVLAAILALLLVVVTTVLSPLFIGPLFNDQKLLLVSLVLTYVTFGGEYLLKGLLAGSGRLRAYGVLIAIEGVTRVGAAIALVVVGVNHAQPFGLAIGLACVIAVALVAPKTRTMLDPGPASSRRELTNSLGNLVLASLLSQLLINAAPIVVKYVADTSQQALAGAFVKAVVITRIPLFLFQAVQAVLLPRLTHQATIGAYNEFRKILYVALMAVTAIGVVGTVGAAVLGDELLKLFGSDFSLSRTDMTLLAAGNAMFLLCMTVAQTLVSVHGQTRTVIGWAAGLVAFVASYALPGDIVLRSEFALLIGAAVSLLVLSVALGGRLRQVTGSQTA